MIRDRGSNQFDQGEKSQTDTITQSYQSKMSKNPQILKLMNEMNAQLKKLYDETINQNPSSTSQQNYRINSEQFNQLKYCFKLNKLSEFQQKYRKVIKLKQEKTSFKQGSCPQSCYQLEEERCCQARTQARTCTIILCCPCFFFWMFCMRCCFYKKEQRLAHLLFAIYSKYERRAQSLIK